jgi:hypothetical protein
MSLQANQAALTGAGKKEVFELRLGQMKGHVHMGTVSRTDRHRPLTAGAPLISTTAPCCYPDIPASFISIRITSAMAPNAATLHAQMRNSHPMRCRAVRVPLVFDGLSI